MTLDAKHVLPPVLALVILAVVGLQTSDALRHTGIWGRKDKPRRAMAPDPYGRLEAELAAPPRDPGLASLRDPFAYGRAPAPVKRVAVKSAPKPEPARPVLTAIFSDNDPRALIRYQDRNYTVKVGDLFAEFRVLSITAEQVVLDRNGEQIALGRPRKGD